MTTTAKIDKSPAAVAVRNAIDTDACAHCFVNEPIFAVEDKLTPSGFVVVCPACAAKVRGATTRTAAKKSTPKVNADNWREHLMATIRAKAALCGADVTGLQMDTVTTDASWGDRIGLVFHGASDEVCERAAKFFEGWASKNLRALGVVGGYQSQESIGYVGVMIFTRWDNGTKGWHRADRGGVTYDVDAGTVTQFKVANRPVEMKRGWATSYVYLPCAD